MQIERLLSAIPFSVHSPFFSLTVVIGAACAVLALSREKSRPPRLGPSGPVPPCTPPSRERRRRAAAPGAVAVVLVLVVAFLIERGGDPVGIRPVASSEANVLIAGQNYAREGLLAHYGISRIAVVGECDPSDPIGLYNHYPVGAMWINGVWRRIGITTERVFRVLPAGCSIAAVVLWFGLYRRVAGPTAAAVASIAMATSYGFLAFADHLFVGPYAVLTSVAAMRCFLRAMDRHEQRRVRWFVLTGLLMFVTSCFTWECHLWMVLFIASYAMLFACPVRRPYLALLALPLLATLALQVAQRRLAFTEGWTAVGGLAAQDRGFLHDFRRRTIGADAVGGAPPHGPLADYPWCVRYPWLLMWRFTEFFGLPAPAAMAMLLLLLMRDRRAPWRVRDWPDEARLAVVLLISGSGWWLVMIQHTTIHRHVMHHALPAYALLMALVWIRCWKTARSGAFRFGARITAGVLAIVLCYPQIDGLVSILRTHWQNDFVDGRGGGCVARNELQCLSRLGEVIPSEGAIVTNYRMPQLMALWTQRLLWDAAGLQPLGSCHDARLGLQRWSDRQRTLRGGKPATLYYVHAVRAGDWQAACADDPLLGFLLAGDRLARAAPGRIALDAFQDGWTTGRSDQSYCPIVARVCDMLVFRLDPVTGLAQTSGVN